jgi:hypothetical protein
MITVKIHRYLVNSDQVQLAGCLALDVGVTFIADDGCDNNATCVQTFSLLADETPPVITCPAAQQTWCRIVLAHTMQVLPLQLMNVNSL